MQTYFRVQGGVSVVKGSSVSRARLAEGGDRVVQGVGLFALGGFADRSGLTAELSGAVPRSGERAPVHDRGRVLVHGLLMLAAGGEACTGIEYLRAQPELFGDAASDSTLYRVVTDLGAGGPARLVMRREPLHSGAQRSLFPSYSHRYQAFYTDQPGTPAQLDKLMRSHAGIEDAVCRLKPSGLSRMPFTDWNANSAWAALCMTGPMLVGWFQTACLTGALAKAAPKKLRRQLWHLPALACRTGRQILLRLPEQHPRARALLATAHPR